MTEVVLISFGMGMIAGMAIIGGSWCFWYARVLRRLRVAGHYGALALLLESKGPRA